MKYETFKRRVLQCPHCKGHISIDVRTEILEVIARTEEEARRMTSGVTERQEEVLRLVRKNGMITAFGEAVTYVSEHGVPKSFENHFLIYLRTSQPRIIPRPALEMLRKELLPSGNLQFWQSQGIGAVVIDDTIRAFIPMELVLGVLAKSTVSGERSVISAFSPEKLMSWLSVEGRKLVIDQEVPFNMIRKLAKDLE